MLILTKAIQQLNQQKQRQVVDMKNHWDSIRDQLQALNRSDGSGNSAVLSKQYTFICSLQCFQNKQNLQILFHFVNMCNSCFKRFLRKPMYYLQNEVKFVNLCKIIILIVFYVNKNDHPFLQEIISHRLECREKINNMRDQRVIKCLFKYPLVQHNNYLTHEL